MYSVVVNISVQDIPTRKTANPRRKYDMEISEDEKT